MVEYFGPGVATLSVPQRATVTNMGAELGVTTSVFPSDASTRAFLEAQGRGSVWTELVADADAEYDRVIDIDLSTLEPMAACPSSPDNIKTVAELSGMKVNQVIIGSCTNSSYRDLSIVAGMLKGRKVHPNVSLDIAPGSRQVLAMLAADGKLADIVSAGARILECGCGPCIGQGQSPANGTVTVRTFNRNFPGRSGTKGDQSYLVSPETACAAALTGEFTSPLALDFEYPVFEDPKSFTVDDSMILPPADDPASVEIIRKPTIGAPPNCKPLPEKLDGVVVIKTGDKTSTDDIMPAGAYLKYRSNIPEYAKAVFAQTNVPGKPTFAERASAVRDSGRQAVIVGRDSFGQGSSREHAAICPMYLGVKAVIAIAIERIIRANMINFGILPLTFANPADYDRIDPEDAVEIADLRKAVQGSAITATVKKQNGESFRIQLNLNVSDEDRVILAAGGRLNVK